jgi:hypothetical protein
VHDLLFVAFWFQVRDLERTNSVERQEERPVGGAAGVLVPELFADLP